MHYVLGLIALPLVLMWGRHWASTQRRLTALAAVAAVSVYGVIVASAYATSAVYAYQADAFDKDKDGVISLPEQSPAQAEAMERAVNDSGRNLTVFFAVPWSLVSAAVFFGLYGAVRAVRRKRKGIA